MLNARQVCLLLALPVSGAQSTDADIARRFAQQVRPFVATYCVSCHSGQNAAAQFDLKQYTAVDQVIRDHPRWTLLLEKLHNGDMPPKAMKQPPAAERQQVMEWIEALRRNEAQKNAGDPGPVLVRRLSNAEYNYTIRDLTGVDIRPTREFPVDPANPEGFDNSGESLAMSPALLAKYLQAARDVASYLVLKPSGIDFAPHPMLAVSDREKYTIQRIVQFYERQPTDYADYFEAAWRYRHRAALGKPDATLASIAAEAGISPKYLPMVAAFLDGTDHAIGPVERLRTLFRMLPAPADKQPELVREGCVKMRNYVVKLRKLTARQFASPVVQGLAGTSQPLMNWKLRAFAANRRDFDREALRMEGEPPPVLPSMDRRQWREYGEDSTAIRNRILAIKARYGDPDLVVPAGQRAAYEAAFGALSNVFPDAFYIRERGRFYPDDSEDKGRLLSAGFHNVMGYFRDDTPLQELILSEEERKELDMLWLEFDTIADHTTRTYIQFFFNQSGEIEGRGRESGSFRPGDAAVTSEKVVFELREQYLAKAASSNNATAAEAIREHFRRVNETIRMVERVRLESEPVHVEGLLRFAARAYRRPLRDNEREELRSYYRELREKNGLSHEDAMRDLVVLVLMSPGFCYRVDALPVSTTVPAARPRTEPLNGYALASRLSYFLWASLPDAKLQAQAESGELLKPEVLAAEAKRMLRDKRAQALATEFAGNWLGFRRFEDHNGVDRQRFPVFTNELRQAMFEEPVRFIDDVIRNDRPVLELIYGKHTFVNAVLARHYGMEAVRPKPGEWVRVGDATRYGRGGILPMAAFLAVNSPGLRTSPVKRGYWVARRVLGEVIPPPPPSVPELPQDEAKMDLPLREMLAKHRENAACAGCHARFDSFGLTFEGYGPVGERRKVDLGGRPVETKAEFPGGTEGTGLEGLQTYIREHREKDFVQTVCRKILVYALGRGLQLSDEPLLEKMRGEFAASGYKISALVEAVVTSAQFRNQRSPQTSEQRGTGNAKAKAE